MRVSKNIWMKAISNLGKINPINLIDTILILRVTKTTKDPQINPLRQNQEDQWGQCLSWDQLISSVKNLHTIRNKNIS